MNDDEKQSHRKLSIRKFLDEEILGEPRVLSEKMKEADGPLVEILREANEKEREELKTMLWR